MGWFLCGGAAPHGPSASSQVPAFMARGGAPTDCTHGDGSTRRREMSVEPTDIALMATTTPSSWGAVSVIIMGWLVGGRLTTGALGSDRV
jgi:hypothetical protein